MKLYWGPHTCAIGIHVLLEEIGRPYTTEQIDVGGGATRQPAFLAVNPKGKVPTLVRDDGTVLTEFGAIAAWLARANPEAGLLPTDAEEEARGAEVLGYVEGTVHGQGFARLFKPEKFAAHDVIHDTLGVGRSSVVAQGREIVEQGFAILARELEGRGFAGGARYGIADAGLFYVERWAAGQDIALPPRLSAHLAMMRARPAVRKVLHLWGEA